ncbi:MAG: helix-turn-helix domain-containing protein [Fimbriimonas sp.]
MRSEQQIERDMLDGLKDITEALYHLGHLTERDAANAQQVRREAGAQPLRLERGNFDASTITPAPMRSPEQIKALREVLGASQAVLAMHLGVAAATLSQWERGARKPDGPALRLLSLIERHGLEHVR